MRSSRVFPSCRATIRDSDRFRLSTPGPGIELRAAVPYNWPGKVCGECSGIEPVVQVAAFEREIHLFLASVQQKFCAGRFIAKTFCADQETFTAGEGERISSVAVCGCGDLFPRASIACSHADTLERQSPNLYSAVNGRLLGCGSLSRRRPRWGRLRARRDSAERAKTKAHCK
jgi:hypothetical protein